jgi:endonuclease/exonuclease/phosphatase family metal-dependent hydrolase
MEINTRLVPEQSEPNYLGKLFIGNNKQFSNMYNHIAEYKRDKLRIMTYNIHMWQGVIGDESNWSHKTDNRNNIIDVINKLKPDILCLQEVLYKDEIISLLLKDYMILSSCSVVPSYYAIPYMTMVFIKKEAKETYINKYDNDGLFKAICTTYDDCFFGQTVGSFKQMTLPNSNVYGVTTETKCFIKFSMPLFDIICTHLTAYDKEGKNRLSELSSLRESLNSNRKTLILGDFNLVNTKEYNDPGFSKYIKTNIENKFGFTQIEYDTITQNYGWVDIYKMKAEQSGRFVNYSNWTGFRVDYIFLANWTPREIDNIDSYFYYSSASDHIPLILDIEDKDYISNRDQKNVPKERAALSRVTQRVWPNVWYDHTKDFLLNNKFIDINTFKTKFINNISIGIYNVEDFLRYVGDNIMLFNIEPLYTIDWLDLDNIFENSNYVKVKNENKFNDPFFTGTGGGSISMGMKSGIYLSPSMETIISQYLIKLQTSFKTQNTSYPIKEDDFLLWAFSLDLNELDKDFKATIIEQSSSGGKFESLEDKMYKEYDLLALFTQRVIKITKRHLMDNIHKYLKIEGLFLCHKAPKTDINDKIIQDLKSSYPIFYEKYRDTLLRNMQIPSLELNNTPFIISFSDFNVGMQLIWKPKKQVGGYTNNHHIVYHNNKQNYLQLNNIY